MTITAKSVSSVLVITFVLWYLLRRTTLGRAYVSDLWSIPRFFSSFVGTDIPTTRGRNISVEYNIDREYFRA
jgi:hypothetical protein